MRRVTLLAAAVLALLAGLGVPGIARDDEAALRLLAERLYSAYPREDLTAVMALWSRGSPDYARHEAESRGLFAGFDRIEVRGLIVRRVVVEGTRARVRVGLELSGVDARTGARAGWSGKKEYVLRCVRERGAQEAPEGWFIQQQLPAVRDLAHRLGEASSAAARQAALAEEPGLLSADLALALRRHHGTLLGAGQLAQALALAELAGMVAERIEDRAALASAWNQEGRARQELGDLDAALDRFRKSLAEFERLGDRRSVVRVRNNLGTHYFTRGDYRRALQAFQESLSAAEMLGEQRPAGAILNNIGLVHQRQGHGAQAREFFRRALGILEAQPNAPGLANLHLNLGRAFLMERDFVAARSAFQASLQLAERQGSRQLAAGALGGLGDTAMAEGDRDAAGSFYERARDTAAGMGDRRLAAASQVGLARVRLSRGELGAALEAAREAVALAEKSRAPESVWRAQLTLGQVHLLRREVEAARGCFKAGIAAIEAVRDEVSGGEDDHQRFFTDKLGPYHELVGLEAAGGDAAAALRWAERARGRVLLAVVRSGRVDVGKGMNAAERDRERALASALASANVQRGFEAAKREPDPARMAALDEQVERARREVEAFRSTVHAAHPARRLERGETHSIGLAELAELVDDRSALLEYLVTPERTFLFVLARSRAPGQGAPPTLRVYSIATRADALRDQVDAFRDRLERRRADFAPAARALYDLLLGAAGEQLKGRQRLVISPDGPLWDLPFQALRTGGDRYLIEDAAITRVHSFAVLRELGARRGTEGAATLLAFGNPALAGGGRGGPAPSLVAAEAEVIGLRDLYGAERSRIYTGAAASEARLKREAAQFTHLHFATHGTLDDETPMYSALLLARSAAEAEEDGLLEAREVLELKLKSRLVVLSACETARGRARGEGLVGMTWAFFVAGCPTVVASQWRVDSATTGELMREFHRQLQSTGDRPGRFQSAIRNPQSAIRNPKSAEALRQAMLRMLRDGRHEHPYYWAPFMVVGDGG